MFYTQMYRATVIWIIYFVLLKMTKCFLIFNLNRATCETSIKYSFRLSIYLHISYHAPVLCKSFFFYDAISHIATLIKWMFFAKSTLNFRFYPDYFCRIELKSMLFRTVRWKINIYEYKYLWTTDIFYVYNRGRRRKGTNPNAIKICVCAMLVFTTLKDDSCNISNDFNNVKHDVISKENYVNCVLCRI